MKNNCSRYRWTLSNGPVSSVSPILRTTLTPHKRWKSLCSGKSSDLPNQSYLVSVTRVRNQSFGALLRMSWHRCPSLLRALVAQSSPLYFFTTREHSTPLCQGVPMSPSWVMLSTVTWTNIPLLSVFCSAFSKPKPLKCVRSGTCLKSQHTGGRGKIQVSLVRIEIPRQSELHRKTLSLNNY